jgi:hypothetical protein
MGARGEQLAASVTAGRRLTVSERVEVGKRLANFAQKAQRTLDSYDRSKVTELEGALFAAQQQETIEVHKCGLAQLQGDNYWIVEAASPAPPPRDGELLLRLGSVAREGLQELDIVLPIDGMGSAELQAAIAALQSVELEIANQLAEAVNGLPIAERQPLIAALAKKWHSKRGGSEVQSQVANLGGATLQEVAMRSLQVSSDGLWLQAIRQ